MGASAARTELFERYSQARFSPFLAICYHIDLVLIGVDDLKMILKIGRLSGSLYVVRIIISSIRMKLQFI